MPLNAKKRLIERTETGKVSRSSPARIVAHVKTLDVEQTASSRQKALRLFCRAMIRLYFQDNEDPKNGKSLGIL